MLELRRNECYRNQHCGHEVEIRGLKAKHTRTQRKSD
ncbi:hypothetical protein D030_3444A, partial [Vibrio parahaemolyticus AQ3810]